MSDWRLGTAVQFPVLVSVEPQRQSLVPAAHPAAAGRVLWGLLEFGRVLWGYRLLEFGRVLWGYRPFEGGRGGL